MPGTSDAFAALEAGDALAYGHYIAYHLVPWDSWEYVAQKALLHEFVAVTDAAGEDLHEQIAGAGLFEVDILEGQLCALGLEEGGFVRLGQ